ncbi:MAG TPA: hypothetical protein VNJ46_00905 [Gaiellaceae bacterium]|nr:hypothetical protein [Gaiellaceae bacterium]
MLRRALDEVEVDVATEEEQAEKTEDALAAAARASLEPTSEQMAFPENSKSGRTARREEPTRRRKC